MLKIRSAAGNLINVDSHPHFVEICDDDGNIGVVFYQPRENVITQIEPGTEEAAVYANKYNVKFVKIIDLTQHHEYVFKEPGDSK